MRTESIEPGKLLQFLSDAETIAAEIVGGSGPAIATSVAHRMLALGAALLRHVVTVQPALPAPAAPYLRAKEVARALSVPVARVYELHRVGRLPGHRVGTRQVRFDLQEVRDALTRN